MEITIEITERDFEALLALASKLNAAVQHDVRRYHSIPGVAAVALHVGLERVAPLFGIALRDATSEADAVLTAVEKELRRRHLKREILEGDFFANQSREMARRAEAFNEARSEKPEAA